MPLPLDDRIQVLQSQFIHHLHQTGKLLCPSVASLESLFNFWIMEKARLTLVMPVVIGGNGMSRAEITSMFGSTVAKVQLLITVRWKSDTGDKGSQPLRETSALTLPDPLRETSVMVGETENQSCQQPSLQSRSSAQAKMVTLSHRPMAFCRLQV